MKVKKKKIYTVNEDCDAERLKEIVRVNNKRIENGEETTITLGHTSDSDPELLTIPVGHAENFEEDGQDLFVDLVIDYEWAEQIKKYNKVSIELWEDQVITPIALLAKNRPSLEVGLIKYDMPNRGKIEHKPYILNNEDIKEDKEVENMSPAEIEQLFTETMQHSEFYAKFCDLMENVIPKMTETVKKMEDTLAPLLEEEAEEPEHADIAGELDEEAKEIEGETPVDDKPEVTEVGDKVDEAEKVEEKPEEVKEKVEEKEEEKKPEVEKNDMVSASANNTYVPNLGDEKKKKKYQADEELVKVYQEKLLKAEQEKAELTAKLEAEKEEYVVKYQMESRKNKLNELSKTYFFDPKDEIEIVGKMNEEQWDMHRKIIATKYQKSPVGRVVNVETKTEERDVAKPEKVQRAIKYAQEHGVDFKTALEKV